MALSTPKYRERHWCDEKGDFEARRIARRDDLRQLAQLLVREPEFFEQFRSGVTLEACQALAISRQHELAAKRTADPLADLFDAVTVCIKAISNVPYKAMKDEATSARVLSELERLEQAITDFK